MKAIVKIGLWKAIVFLTAVIFLVSCQKYPPTVKTVSASMGTPWIAVASGSVVDDGGADVISYGICLSTNSLPTISDTKKECSSTLGNSAAGFKASFSDMEINTTYYLRAYAINSEGIAYGEVLSTKGSYEPGVMNVSVTEITLSEATFSATVSPHNTNCENWFEYGIIGQTMKKVSVANTSGNKAVEISLKVSDLTPGKTFSLVAKAKNEYGTRTSDAVTFETYAVADYDGNLYHSVTIGNQTWLKENFRGTHYANGDPIANVTNADSWSALTTGAYCWYNNDSE
ncbi:MAG: hypothetical protein ACOYL8_04330, partial [Patescibacteria group bacterium]